MLASDGERLYVLLGDFYVLLGDSGHVGLEFEVVNDVRVESLRDWLNDDSLYVRAMACRGSRQGVRFLIPGRSNCGSQ